MSKILDTKPSKQQTTYNERKAQLMEYLNKHQNELLKQTTGQIIMLSGSNLPRSTLYRIIKQYKNMLISESFKRLNPELASGNTQ